jgi:type IV secretory pathway VirB2 component (pilin)
VSERSLWTSGTLATVTAILGLVVAVGAVMAGSIQFRRWKRS